MKYLYQIEICKVMIFFIPSITTIAILPSVINYGGVFMELLSPIEQLCEELKLPVVAQKNTIIYQ